MPTFSYPGVYISEKKGGPAPIVGSSTSTLALIGFTREGETNEVIETFGFPDFQDKLGGFTSLSLLPTHAFHFFKNGGTKAVVIRVVADDAVVAAAFLSEAITGEVLTPDTAFDGVLTSFTFVNDPLVKTPVVPGTLAITTGPTNTESFSDNGDGTLTGSAGGSGTIDYETGEVTLTYFAAPDAADAVSAAYSYKTFGFDMKWEGVAGDEFDVVISGDPLFEDQSTASFSRYIVEVRRTIDGVTSTLEQFSGVVLTDATDDDYILTVMNDELGGSKYIDVTGYANNEAPSSLSGSQVSAEALTEVPTYNGLVKQVVYTLANTVNPTSLSMSIAFGENAVSLGAAVVGAAQTGTIPGGAVADDANLAITFDQATDEIFTLTTPGDGTGALTGDQGGTGTINFDTGAFSVTLFVAAAGGEAITASWLHRPHTIIDDGNGAVSIDDASLGPSIWILDTNGTNTIDYDGAGSAAEITLTWKKTTNPSLGPSTSGAVAHVQTVDYYTQAANTEVTADITGGSDGSAITRSNISAAALAADKLGLFALDKTDELLQIVIPDFETDPTVSGDLIDYADTRQDRFALVSVPEGLGVQEAKNYKTVTLNKSSNRAAIYYPHIKIIDPITEKAVNVPPGGHVAGIYARTDSERNVAKAPAGVTDGAIRFAIGLERNLSFNECGELNKVNINCLLDNTTVGRVVWGARTMESVGEFPYIQMRRLFMFVEKSVFNSTQIHVFESNTPSLRARIKLQIEAFLLSLFNTNHFSGATPADAFFVVDKTTADDVTKGIVRFEIGLAPTRPAEFISFEFQSKTLEAA